MFRKKETKVLFVPCFVVQWIICLTKDEKIGIGIGMG